MSEQGNHKISWHTLGETRVKEFWANSGYTNSGPPPPPTHTTPANSQIHDYDSMQFVQSYVHQDLLQIIVHMVFVRKKREIILK